MERYYNLHALKIKEMLWKKKTMSKKRNVQIIKTGQQKNSLRFIALFKIGKKQFFVYIITDTFKLCLKIILPMKLFTQN